MEIRFLSNGEKDQKLCNLVQSIAAYMGVDCAVETRIVISSENRHLIEVVDRLMGVVPAEPSSMPSAPAAPMVPAAPSASEATTKICKVCGESFEPTGHNQTCCSRAECKKAAQAEYQRRWQEKKAELQAGPVEVSPSIGPLDLR